MLPRLMAARAAASQWIDVAAACPARFDEGALRSAQARARAVSLARNLGAETMAQDMAADLADVDFSQVFRLTISGDGLAAMSLAEDQAGFAVETLAARDVAGATLALADDHKAAAQRLFTLSGVDKDPRQKLYDLTGLIASPQTTRDETTGLRTPTLALVEMSVARAYLRATGASDSSSASTDGTASGTDSGGPSAKTLRLMAESIARRAGLALTLGYPAFDATLFT